MVKPSTIPAVFIFLFMAAACGGTAGISTPIMDETSGIPADPGMGNATRNISATPAAASATHTYTPSNTPTLAPDAWETMPVVPVASGTARAIFAEGQRLGNNPRAFSILGDCLSLPINLFGNYGRPGKYNLGDYDYLQPVIDYFLESFLRQSVTVGDGFNTAAVLSPLRADPAQCGKGENPLECEYRLNVPSYAIISLGTDDWTIQPDVYEERMRRIVEYTIARGIIPILATKADNREGDNAFNKIVARLAYEYDVPLWNFWLAVQALPLHGVANEQGHLTWADPNHLDYTYSMQVAVPVRNVTALQTLEAVWKGVTAD
ncbi:MAG: SGNH/GDSL hydrolase family protein [Anaerolineales bacterium]|nr:SGNH/GDSL hydrolase family protein [Anaerolineales bacterium]